MTLRQAEDKKEKLDKGWTIKYITDLTSTANYYLRGEEYSFQMDYFFDNIQNKKNENKNSFSSAFATDYTIDLLLKNSTTNG